VKNPCKKSGRLLFYGLAYRSGILREDTVIISFSCLHDRSILTGKKKKMPEENDITNNLILPASLNS
jgi:hypothetical protein